MTTRKKAEKPMIQQEKTCQKIKGLRSKHSNKLVKNLKKIACIYLTFCIFAIQTPSFSKAQAKTVRDSRNRLVKSDHPMRIATGALAADEIILEILSRSNSRKRLIAVSTIAENPEYSNISNELQHIKGRIGSETESIITLKPDLVILASYNRPELISRIESMGIKTFVLGNFSSLNDIKTNIMLLGNLIDEVETAKKIADEFSKELDKIEKKSKKNVRISCLNWTPGGTTMAKGTIFDDILKTINVENAANKFSVRGWPKLSLEKVLELNPKYIISAGNSSEKELILRSLRGSLGWNDLAAVKSGNLIIIPKHHLTSTSHHILKAVKQLYAKIHPTISNSGKK
ncbi:MAG: ABC transporter substrate-binding protein [Bdellovibrionota bacterium]